MSQNPSKRKGRNSIKRRYIPLDEAFERLGRRVYGEDWSGEELQTFHQGRKSKHADRATHDRRVDVHLAIHKALKQRHFKAFIRGADNQRISLNDINANAPRMINIPSGDILLTDEDSRYCDIDSASFNAFLDSEFRLPSHHGKKIDYAEIIAEVGKSVLRDDSRPKITRDQFYLEVEKDLFAKYNVIRKAGTIRKCTKDLPEFLAYFSK